MVKRRSIIAAIVFALGLGGGDAQAAPASDRQNVTQLMENCDAHKFETIVESTVDGQPHQSKVRLCGKEGQSDSEWIGTLGDAIAKLNANTDMPVAIRTQIVTAINAEIARLKSAQAAGSPSVGATAMPPPRLQPQTVAPLSDDYASLPPLPSAPPPPPHVLGPGGMLSTEASSSETGRRSERQAAPPMPLAAGPAPKLTLSCYAPGDVGGDAPCTGFDRETTLTIRAGENISQGISILFLRNGEQRASVELAQMRSGKSLTVPLPREVCQGVSDGSLELQLVQGGALLKADGPYSLRC
jgi:hypothetical protein